MSEEKEESLFWRVVQEARILLEQMMSAISDPAVRRAVLRDLGQPLDPQVEAREWHAAAHDGDPEVPTHQHFAGIDEYLKTADPSREAFLAAAADLRAVVAVIKNTWHAAHGEHIAQNIIDSAFQLLAVNFLFRRWPAFYWLSQPFGFGTDLATTDPLLGRLGKGIRDFYHGKPGRTRPSEDWLATLAVGIVIALQKARPDIRDRIRILHGWEGGPGSPTPVGDALGKRALSVSVDLTPEEAQKFGQARAVITLISILADQGGPGTFLSFSGNLQFEKELVKGWLLKLELAGASAFSVYLPEQGDAVLEGPADARAVLTWEQKPDPNLKPGVLPIRGKTRLEFGSVLASVGVSRAGVEARLVARKTAFVLESGDDELLKRGLKGGTLRTEFDFGFGYANHKLFLEGGVGLQATLPAQRAIGPVEVRSVTLGLRVGEQPGQPDLSFETSVTLVIKLGAVTLSVDRIGVLGSLNFGIGDKPWDADLDFKAPSGIGLKIDADCIAGGGYIFRDPHLDQYAGIVELKISNVIEVKAIALLSRKIDNKPAFSLLLIITAEGFTPINLWMGFKLTGFGGIFGLDRSINPEALEAGVKTGALDMLLFPKDPVGDAPRIVATAGAAFPPTLDRNILGAMVRIVWGTESLVTIDLAVILEFAGWSVRRIALLGKVRTVFPTPEKPVVQISLDLVGTIDRDAKRAFAHLAITVGKLGVFTLSGEAAMLYTWGDRPNYVISIGGFNPRFQRPEKFPALERVRFSLAENKGLTVDATFYVAVTTNSFQIGGSLDLVAQKGKFSIKGGIGIDALIQSQQPCYAFDLRANLELLAFGEPLFTVRLAGTLLGDKPWSITGKATFEIWIFDYTIDFSHTWGETEEEAPATTTDLGPDVILALGDRRNWTTDLPAGLQNPVVLRRVPGGDAHLHPLGALVVTQRVAPLGLKLTRCGNARLRGQAEFRIERVAIAGTNVSTDPVNEPFAPAQFVDMSDDEKLGSPAFKDLQAGVRSQPAPLASGDPVETDAGYLTKVYNPTRKMAVEPATPSPTLGIGVKFLHRPSALFASTFSSRTVRFGKSVASPAVTEPLLAVAGVDRGVATGPVAPPAAPGRAQPLRRTSLHILRTTR